MIHFKDNKNKSPLNTRWAQMTKQEQIIERKKMEIKAKLESQKQAAALAAQAKLANPSSDDNSANIFSNDGSFMNQFKTLLEKQKQENAVKVQKEQKKSEKDTKEPGDYDGEPIVDKQSRPNERGHREHHRRRWNDRGHNRHSVIPLKEDRKHHDFNQPFQADHHEHQASDHEDWTQDQDSNPPEDQFRGGPGMLPPGHPPGNMPHPLPPGGPPGPPGPPGWDMMGPGPGPNMGPRPMGPGGHMMGPRGPNMPPMPPGPMPPGHMPPGGMPPFMGGPPNFPMPPNWGPNGPRGPCGPGGMPPNLMGPNGPMPFFPPPFNPSMMGPPGPPPPPPPTSMAQNSPNNSMMGANGPPMMGQNISPNSGPPGPPGHPGMHPNGPPNSKSGPKGPPGPPGPMMGPNGPTGPPGPIMGPNGPRPLMPPGTMPMGHMGNPFMLPRPPFGPNSNFNNPNMPFMPRNSMGPPRPELKPDNNVPPEPMKHQNIPPPMPLTLNHISKPKDLELGDIPAQSSQVFSPDSFPPTVVQAASEVAANGDRWENVLKAIHTQDQNMWFLHNPNGTEYKAFRKLVEKMRVEREHQNSVKDEDKYEPEFCLDDDDSNDARPHFRDEGSNSNNDSNPFWQQYSNKREATSSQSDDDSVDNKRERRRRKKKSRWGDEPQMDLKPPGVVDLKPPGLMDTKPPGLMDIKPPGLMDIKPPGLMDIKPPGLMDIKPPGLMDFKPPGFMDARPPGLLPPLLPPGMMAGARLARIDESGLKLTNVNRNNQALMQYAMTNYGSTNLEPEEWKKCEDNFKLNLLYQDMLKKRSEVERLAAAGKNKYEYDSDEDTSAGTWEHKLRSREMNATEKWADELTKQAAGKHHIGDFLPPEELRKFMEKYSAVKSGKEPDLSDYKEFKLKEDNVGFKMLQKFGWSEGQGLGADGSGIVDPINKAQQPVSNLGLGAKTGDNVSSEDDEFDAYRKRMMLAYRFRPNPLNNPRRPYY